MALPNVNQFGLTQVAGQLDLEFPGSVVSARVSPNQATPLVAGQPVMVENSGGQTIPNIIAAVPGGPVWGVVVRNLKDQQFAAGAACEVARDASVMYLPASVAIARGTQLEIDPVAFTVKPYGGVNVNFGEAYDQAVNPGDLIRVWFRPVAGSGSRGFKQLDVVATLAQINAGTVLIPGVVGQSIRVLNFLERVTGAFATGTGVALQSSATGVVVETTAEAGLTNGAVLLPASPNVALGAGFGALLPAGEGLSVANVGAAQTGGTSIEYVLTYQQF